MIGDHAYVGPYCLLGLVTLEPDVLLGPSVQIPSGPRMHGIERLDVPIREQTGINQRITVGRDCWIGANSILLTDVSNQTVVGASSVVTKTFASQSIIVGNPARFVRNRSKPLTADEQSETSESIQQESQNVRNSSR